MSPSADAAGVISNCCCQCWRSEPTAAWAESLAHDVGELQHAAHGFQRPADDRAQIGLQDGLRALVDGGDAEGLVERQHAGRQVRQHAFQIDVGAFQLLAVALDHAAGLVQLARHGVERAGQLADFVAFGRLGQRPVVAHAPACVPAARLSNGRTRRGQRQRHGDGAEGGQQQRQRQRDAVELAQAQPRQGQLLVVAEPLLHLIGVVCDLLRHGLEQLQPARLGGGAERAVVAVGAGQRNDDAQVQPAVGAGRDGIVRLGRG